MFVHWIITGIILDNFCSNFHEIPSQFSLHVINTYENEVILNFVLINCMDLS